MPCGSFIFGRRQLLACLALVTTVVTFVGCTSNPNARKPSEDQAEVSGTVVNNGKPVTLDSEIMFESTAKSAVAVGKINAEGKYTLYAADSTVGIPAGNYSVTVRPPEKAAAPTSASPSSEEYKKKMMQGGNATAPAAAASDIPEKYRTMTSTTLKFDLKKGPQTIDIDFAKLP